MEWSRRGIEKGTHIQPSHANETGSGDDDHTHEPPVTPKLFDSSGGD